MVTLNCSPPAKPMAEPSVSGSFMKQKKEKTLKKEGYLYILSNKNRTTLYTGVTSDIKKRILKHKSGLGSKFTRKYGITDLVYYELATSVYDAIKREKQIKNWHREWKLNLIKSVNPEMKNLAAGWFTREQIDEFRKIMLEMLKRVQHDKM